MKLSKFYPNVLNDFFVRSVITNIHNIKKNCIFVNLDNLTNFDIPSSLKQHIFIVTQIPLLDKNIMSINVLNIYDELVRIFNIYYNLNLQYTKIIGILNDDFLNYKKILNDFFTYGFKEKIGIINNIDDIDKLYNEIGNYNKRKFKYIFLIFHSTEICFLDNIITLDYIILPKSSYTTSLKSIVNIHKLLKDSGIIINNSNDFNDLFISNKYISFGFNENCIYRIINTKQHNKIVTGSLYKNNNELSEFLLCINNYDCIYFIISLFILCDNEYHSVELVHIFFSKYIL